MKTKPRWQYDEYRQVGKDYGEAEEVAVYDSSHAQFRDVERESLELIERIALDGDDVLVDIGCGTGAFAVKAAAHCDHVYAVDVSASMLEACRARATQAGADNITFSHSGFLNFECPDRWPSVVTSTLALHHLPDFWKGVALQRIHELLAPGGRFYLADVILRDDQPVETIDAFIGRQAKIGGDFLREDAEGHFREEYSTYDWVMEGLLERAGFAVREREEKDGVFVSYLCDRLDAIVS